MQKQSLDMHHIQWIPSKLGMDMRDIFPKLHWIAMALPCSVLSEKQNHLESCRRKLTTRWQSLAGVILRGRDDIGNLKLRTSENTSSGMSTVDW